MDVAMAMMLAILPPMAFDYEPTFYTLRRVEVGGMEQACGLHDPKLLLVGCANVSQRVVTIRADVEGLEYHAVLRHEWAHLNGWKHD